MFTFMQGQCTKLKYAELGSGSWEVDLESGTWAEQGELNFQSLWMWWEDVVGEMNTSKRRNLE